jgi:hypothetical protein
VVLVDAEEAGAKVEKFEGGVEEEVEELTDVGMSMGTLSVGGLNILTMSTASVLEGVDSSDEEQPVDVGIGLPLDITLPHGSSPKT